MGNCVFKGLGVADSHQHDSSSENVVKVVTPNGGVMELQGPITAESITNEFPGYGIFLNSRHASTTSSPAPPLLSHAPLSGGHSYSLLPLLLQDNNNIVNYSDIIENVDLHTDTSSVVSLDMTPYRMSVDTHPHAHAHAAKSSLLTKRHSFDRHAGAAAAAAGFTSRWCSGGNGKERKARRGVWKVRLAINSDQLSEILSQDARTEALIESVRTVAKCAAAATSSPAKSSDQRSWASSDDHTNV